MAAWLAEIEGTWGQHANRNSTGALRMSLSARLDYMRNLSAQLGDIVAERVVYSKAGSLLSAARLTVRDAMVDTSCYWALSRSEEESLYLVAVLNSDIIANRISDVQVTGEAGTRRHLDNLVWTLPIPDFSAQDPLHLRIVMLARRAEVVASSANLVEVRHFVTKRRAIRAALAEDGVAAEIEALVEALLGA